MYKSYKLVIFMVNAKGGESETVDHLYKEVDGSLVPMDENEAILKMLSETARIGGNPSVQRVKAMLFDTNGGLIKIEEVIKEVAEQA